MNVTDDTWGPTLEDKFDFTLLFEQAIFSIVPSTLILCLATTRVLWLRGHEVRARTGGLLWAKIGMLAAMFGIQLASVVLWALPSTPKTRTALPAAILSFLLTIALGFLLCSEHKRAIGPSKLLSGYLIISTLLDIAQARSLVMRGTYTAIGSLCVAGIVTKVILICLEEVSKTSLLVTKYRNAPLESISGSINRTVFWWLQSLFRKGYSSFVFLHDLSPIHEKLASRPLFSALEQRWHKGDQKGKHALTVATLSSFYATCIMAVLPRLCLAGFRFSQPLFIERVIDFVSEPTNGQTHDIAGGLIGAAALIYLGIAVTDCYYQHLNYQLVTMIRGGLVSLIFDKTMRLDHTTAKDSEALTLMSADIEGIEPGVQLIHETWASLVELGIGLYLLQRQIGAACVFVAIPAIIASLLTSRLIRAMGPARMLWSKGIQKRVAEASKMLTQIKSLKVTGLAAHTAESIQNLRVKELIVSRKFRLALIRILTTGRLSDQMTPVIVVAGAIFWTRRGADEELTVAQVFAILAVVSLVSTPISQLISCLPNAMASIACFDRIQEYLLLPDAQDPRHRHRLSTTHTEASILPGNGLTPADAVVIKGGYFAPSGKTQNVLSNINISFPTATYTTIIGPVGSGKSILLKIILGELALTQGSIEVSQDLVAYCDQTPWLRNVSIRDNIIGRTEYDGSWYATVVKACSLIKDFERLPSGDMGLVGSGGIALSGGQKHRVALARAVYSRKPILVLDDVFSALDNVTSRKVFNNLLGPDGLLRELRITIIQAAHSVHDINCADKVVVLDKEGRIVHQSEPSAFPLQNDKVKQLIEQPILKDGDEDLVEDEDIPPATQSLTAEELEKRDLERQTGDISLYRFYFSSVSSIMAITWLILATIYIGLGRAPQLWLRFWSESGMNESPGSYFGAYSAFAISSVIASAISVSFFMLSIVPESAQNLHKMFLQTVIKAPFWFFSTTDSGIMLNRFSQDMTLFDNRLPVAMYHTIYDVLNVLLSVALISVGAQYFATIIPVCAVALYLLAKFYLRTSRQIRHLDLEAKSPLYTIFTDTIDGLVTIRAFGWKTAFLEDSLDLLDLSQKPYYLLFCIQRWLKIMLDLFVAAIAVVLVTFAVKFQENTTQGALGVALINIIAFNTELTELVSNWTDLETSLGAISRLRSFLWETPNEDPKNEDAPLPSDWPANGMIQFNNVSAAYKEGGGPVLHNVSLQIKPGQRVGICGRTGGGKTSLLLSLLGLLELTSGSIKVDGLDLSTVSRKSVRTKLTTLPQDPVTLPGTIRQNLVQDHCIITDETLVSSLKKLGIWNIVEEAGGLDTEFAGLTLSRGQEQLFCLARALLRRSTVLLLDEPTTNVDPGTASEIQSVIEDEFKACTILAVVHKLEMVMGWDLVVVMDAGQVAEIGNPKELIKQRGSVFNSLWESRHDIRHGHFSN